MDALKGMNEEKPQRRSYLEDECSIRLGRPAAENGNFRQSITSWVVPMTSL